MKISLLMLVLAMCWNTPYKTINTNFEVEVDICQETNTIDDAQIELYASFLNEMNVVLNELHSEFTDFFESEILNIEQFIVIYEHDQSGEHIASMFDSPTLDEYLYYKSYYNSMIQTAGSHKDQLLVYYGLDEEDYVLFDYLSNHCSDFQVRLSESQQSSN